MLSKDTKPVGWSLTGVKTLTAGPLSARDPGLDAHNLDAGFAACPKTVAEVQAIVRWCATHSTPLVTQGGRTGLAGGAASTIGQVILMTERLNAIREIDAPAKIAVVDAGVTLSTLEEAVAPHGLTVGIDIAARGSCTIGGMVATNAGGGEAFRNGVMRQRVLGLEAVMPDGALFSDLKKVIKSNEGYDIKQLLIGSEGTLGVVTGVVLKLEQATHTRKTVLAAADDTASALLCFERLRKRFGDRLLAAEIMLDDYFQTTSQALGLADRFAHLKASVYFLAEVDDSTEGDEAFQDTLAESLEAGDINNAIIAKNEQERRAIWQVREDSFLIDKCHPGGCWFDISVPLGALDRYIRDSITRITALNPDLRLFIMGHLGDGNLHYTVAGPEPVEHLYDDIADALYKGLSAIGGSFSAEHGIGREKHASLFKHGNATKLSLMRTIKRAVDPKNIMNPGKVISPE